MARVPKIPRYDVSGASLTTDVNRAMEDPEKMAGAGEAIESIGVNLEKFGEHMEKIKALQQSTAGMDLLTRSVDKKYQEALMSPDIHGAYQKFDNDVHDEVEKYSRTIDSLDAREKFQGRADSLLERKRSALQSTLWQKSSLLTQGTFDQSVKTLTDQALKSPPSPDGTEDHRATYLSDMDNLHDEFKSLGALSPRNEAVYQKSKREFQEKALRYDLSTQDQDNDPVKIVQGVKDEFEKGDKGKYKGLDPSRREAVSKDIDSDMKRAEQTVKQKKIQFNHVADKMMTWKSATEVLTQDELEHYSFQMTPERYGQLSKRIADSHADPKDNHPNEYATAFDFISDTDHSERDCVNELFKMEKNKNLNTSETNSLIKLFMISPDDDPNFKIPKRANLEQMLEAQEDKDKMSKDRRQALGWLTSIKTHYGNDKEAAADTAKKVVEDYNKADKTQKQDTKFASSLARKHLSSSFLQKHPEVAQFPKEGKVVGSYRYFPDGTSQEENQ